MRPLFLFIGLLLLWPMRTHGQELTPANDPPSFAHAEARIVYNKANGLPRYEGVTILYAFQVVGGTGWNSADALVAAIAERFTQVRSAELVAEDGLVLLLIDTEGDLANHSAYRAMLEEHPATLARHPWTYNLK